MSGINIRLVVTQRDIKIITTALRDYSKNHPKTKCDAYEAESLAELIDNQAKRQETKE